MSPFGRLSLSSVKTHLLIAMCWLALLLTFLINKALLGGEEDRLERQRGTCRSQMRDLEYEEQRLLAQLEILATPDRLAAGVRKLGLPIEAPMTVDVSLGSTLAEVLPQREKLDKNGKPIVADKAPVRPITPSRQIASNHGDRRP